ncbi:MAG: DUF4287 domain-containing protein [Pyrinomonadaceae bacterium]|nr:DUF4287 domain-containing protein [Pyrinomonadaceae bacterium]MBA3568913.1 DUF4287 domain-containing protein [Pyrinomonadaceae bacterium]
MKAQSPRMRDEAVKAKTGKKWNQWFAILDKAGAKKMTHQEIVKFLNSQHDLGPWWSKWSLSPTNRHVACARSTKSPAATRLV